MRGGHDEVGGIQGKGRGSFFLQISSSVALALPDGARIASNNRWPSFPRIISVHPRLARRRTSRATSLRGHLEIPSASTFSTPGMCFATRHQPLVSSSLPSRRITNPALVSRDPPHRLIHDTADALSLLIKIGSPSFSGRSLSCTIKHHAVKNMPHSSSRLVDVRRKSE